MDGVQVSVLPDTNLNHRLVAEIFRKCNHNKNISNVPVASSASFPIAFCARFRSYTCMRPYFNLSKIENHKYLCKANYVGTDLFSWEDDTIVFGLEPLHGVSLSQLVLETNLCLSASALSD